MRTFQIAYSPQLTLSGARGRIQSGLEVFGAATKHTSLGPLINVSTVEPERAAELAEQLRLATEETMQFVPGFISATIDVSTDNTRVVNYAQWQSAEAYTAMFEDPSTREHMGVCAAIATGFEPHLYTVESVHLAPNV